MRISVWTAAIIALVVWSLLAWGGHALLDWSSDWAAANADKISPVPEVVEWVSWSFRSLGNASEIVVVIVWGIGSILIVGLAGLVSRFLAGRQAKFSDLKKVERIAMPIESKRIQTDLQIETIAAACALIAYADGVVRPAEHHSMAASLSRFGLIDEQSRQELLIEFEQATARFEIDHAVGEMAALSTIARLQKNGRFAKALVETCRHIGEADGHYIVEEQSALVKICRQLRIEPVEAGAFATVPR